MSDSERKTILAKYNINENARGTAASRIAAGGPPKGDAVAGAAAGSAAGAADGGSAASGPQSGAGRRGQGGQGGGGRRGQGGASGAAGAAGDAAAGGSQRQDFAIVWKLLPDKTLQPVQVGVGVTDFTFTAMLSGNLNPGDELVIGQSTTKATTAQAATRSPIGGPAAPAGPRRF